MDNLAWHYWFFNSHVYKESAQIQQNSVTVPYNVISLKYITRKGALSLFLIAAFDNVQLIK